MKRFLIKCLLALFISPLILSNALPQFGYVTYPTIDLCDDMNALALRRLLPEGALPIPRTDLATFQSDQTIHTLIAGCYVLPDECLLPGFTHEDMCTAWIPSSDIDPFYSGLNIDPNETLSSDVIAHYKNHSPIGTVNSATQTLLNNQGISTIITGPMLLTLDNDMPNRRPVIVMVDVDEAVQNYIESAYSLPVITFSHQVSSAMAYDRHWRLNHAQKLLHKYGEAQCVISSSLGASLACLGLETPVLHVLKEGETSNEMHTLLRTCSQSDLINGLSNFSCNTPPPNDQTYVPLREQLIDQITNWIASVNTSQ